jgi:nitrite reductase/ring-hydroxylating ferredoxin subunit
MANNHNPWMYAGLSSAYPNMQRAAADNKTQSCPPNPPTTLEQTSSLDPSLCKFFTKPTAESLTTSLTLQQEETSTSLSQQSSQSTLMIFRYHDQIHAIDHACPHQAYPLTKASLSDIEDFGIVLSVGITCPKHGWTFDLFTGEADVSRYRLGIYEVDAREGENGDEVWVRKKERKRIG